MELRHALFLAVMASLPAQAYGGEEVSSCARGAPREGGAPASSCLECHAKAGRRAPRRLAADGRVSAADRREAAEPEPRSCGLDRLEPDAPSRQCLECHAAGLHGAPPIRAHASHPFDVPYRGGGSGQRTLAGEHHVRARLHLPGGLVTCTTCHDGRTRSRFRTARPLDGGANWRERLCNVCHVLDGGDRGGWVARNG